MNDLRNAVFPSITSSSSLLMNHHSGPSYFQTSNQNKQHQQLSQLSQMSSQQHQQQQQQQQQHTRTLRNEVLPTPSFQPSSSVSSHSHSHPLNVDYVNNVNNNTPNSSLNNTNVNNTNVNNTVNNTNNSNNNNPIQPSSSTVVIGKGRVPKKAPGNRKLRSLVHSKVQQYVNAKSKMVKSSIVTDIYFTIQEMCLKEGSSPPFVRYDGNSYTITSESVAREKITSTFRDCLHDRYKSSSKNKVAKRRLANKEKAENERKQRLQAQQRQFLNLPPSQQQQVTIDNNITSTAPQQTQQAQTTFHQKQQQQLGNSNSISKLFPNHLPKTAAGSGNGNGAGMTRIGTFSAPMFEFLGPVDRSLFDMVAPVPIPDMDCASTCSSSSSTSYQSQHTTTSSTF